MSQNQPFPLIRPGFVMLLAAWMLALTLVACSSGSSSSDTTPTPSVPAITEADLVRIGEEIFPETPTGGFFGVCGGNGDLTRCPVTDRLAKRLTETKSTLCRCQNGSDTRTITSKVDGDGGVVSVTMYRGDTTYDLKVVSVDGRLLVDDQTCGGKGADTSIYTTLSLC